MPSSKTNPPSLHPPFALTADGGFSLISFPVSATEGTVPFALTGRKKNLRQPALVSARGGEEGNTGPS